MGCYGVGVSRLLAAALKVSRKEEGWERLVWPLPIAPFYVCVLPLVNVSLYTVHMYLLLYVILGHSWILCGC